MESSKREKIILASLKLFAKNGYDATPTTLVAKEAGVSEGLIFKHFGTKQGLLDAVFAKGEAKLAVLFSQIIAKEENAREMIRAFIELPFSVPESEFNFWSLIMQLKWRQEYRELTPMKSIRKLLAQALGDLGIAQPQHEARLLTQIVDSMAIEILQGKRRSQHAIKRLLLEKYSLVKSTV